MAKYSDHPDIARALRTGYPNGEPRWPHCPVCGKECERIYQDKDGYNFGCNLCVRQIDGWDYEEEQ